MGILRAFTTVHRARPSRTRRYKNIPDEYRLRRHKSPVRRARFAGITRRLDLSPSANFTRNLPKENFEPGPVFANFTKIRAEIGWAGATDSAELISTPAGTRLRGDARPRVRRRRGATGRKRKLGRARHLATADSRRGSPTAAPARCGLPHSDPDTREGRRPARVRADFKTDSRFSARQTSRLYTQNRND